MTLTLTLTHLDLDRIEGLAGRLRESKAEVLRLLAKDAGNLKAASVISGWIWDTDSALADLTAMITRIRELEADKARLDWLEQHTVNVRDPLVYGSRDMFWAGPHTEDGITDPSDLRAQIDTALQRKTS